MTQLVHERMLELRDREGTAYRRVLVYAERQPAGTWAAWVEFVSATGDKVVQTDRETTQSTLNGVAYWATGLQPTYFEGALDRASRRAGDPRPGAARPFPWSGGGLVCFRVRSVDPAVTFRMMATQTVIPGLRRQVHDGGIIVYVRAEEPVLAEMPKVYEFLAQFRSTYAAALLASRIAADLEGTGAILEIRRVEVPIEVAAIRDALVEAAANRPDFDDAR
jgi:hypothetical protein